MLLLLLMMMVMAIVVMIISRSGRRRGRFRRRHCTARSKRKAFLVFFCRHHHSRQQCIVHFPVHHLQLSSPPPPPPPQLPRGSFLQLKAEITKLVHIEGPYTQRPFFSSIHVGSRCSPLLLLLLLLVSCADPNTERVEHCAKRERRRLGAGTGSQQIVVGCWLLLLLLQGAHSSAAVMAHRIRPAI